MENNIAKLGGTSIAINKVIVRQSYLFRIRLLRPKIPYAECITLK